MREDDENNNNYYENLKSKHHATNSRGCKRPAQTQNILWYPQN
jgi:hypothetical protein